MGISLDVTPLIDRLCDAVSARRERNRKICGEALKCIRDERLNFERIVAKKPYGKNPLERKARTEYSFEILGEAMRKLTRVRKFRRDAEELKNLCEQELRRPDDEREAAEVLALITKLAPRLAASVNVI